MKRFLIKLLMTLLFLLLLGFAFKNTESVAVRYFLGFEWQAPLVLVLLVAACIGALVGLLAGLFQALRLRREVAALKRELRAVKQLSAAPLLPPSDLL